MALQSSYLHFAARFSLPPPPPHVRSYKLYAAQPPPSPPPARRRAFSLFTITTVLSFSSSNIASWSKPALSDFVELPNSGGVKVLDLRVGEGSQSPSSGDTVVIHYYGRLAAKQGWRFDSTYDHKDENGDPLPFQFVLGSGKVISGIESAVRSMKVGDIRRVIIPPSEGYQNTSQEPIPPNFFDRQRLFTTIFNPTRLANGEGSTLGILIFDIELNNRGTLIYALVAHGMPPVVVAEYTASSGNFNSIAYQCLQKLPSSNNKFTYNCDEHTFNYLIHDGFTYCVVAEESAGRQIPMAFLEYIKDDFAKKYGGGEASTVPAHDLKIEYGQKLKEHMQYFIEHPEEISKLAKVKAQVSEVKGVMLENIEKVLDRGQKIELLVDKTENLHQQAREFKSTGTRLHRKMWLQKSKMKLVVFAIVIVFILIIVLSICGGFDCGK